MGSNPIVSYLVRYLIMLGVPLGIFCIFWLIYWLRNYYSDYVEEREIFKGINNKFDSRIPILYLRNFRIDGSAIKDSERNVPNGKFKLNLPTLKTRDIHLNRENYIRRKVSSLGPLISIGDDNSTDIGIYRISKSDQEWQTAVEKHMTNSRMIILRTYSHLTPGIAWELDNILNKFLYKTLFFVESNESELLKELNRQIKLKFPNIRPIGDMLRIKPYFFWITKKGKKKYSYWIRKSSLFKISLEIALKDEIKVTKSIPEHFEINKMPYLLFKDFFIEVFEIGKPIVIQFSPVNLGNHTAKTMKRGMGFTICKPIDKIDPKRNGQFLSYNNNSGESYIAKNKLSKGEFKSNDVLQKNCFDEFMNGNFVLYFFGEIEYQNATSLANKKIRVYKFCITIKRPSLSEYMTIYNITQDTN